MEFKKLNGKPKNVVLAPYIIKWNDDSLSKFQWNTKQWIRPFWISDVCLEEFVIPGTRLRIDLMNVSKKIAIEVDGIQHNEYSEFLHKGSRLNLLAQMKRDEKKRQWCLLNSYNLVNIDPGDKLSVAFFKEKFNITL